MAHHICAHYYADTQSFLPPTRQLGFNAQLQINDSLLAQSYIEAYDISYPEALRRIEDEVNELKQKLQNDGSCELHDIGMLRLNAEGNIEFDPCDAGILTPSLYGLNHLDIVPLSEIAEKPAKVAADEETKTEAVMPQPQPIPQLAASKTTDDSVDDDTDDDDDSKYVRIRISTIRHIAVVAAVVAALCICAIPFGKLTQPQTTRSYVDTSILYSILPECLRTPAKKPVQKHVVVKQQHKAEAAKPADSQKQAVADKQAAADKLTAETTQPTPSAKTFAATPEAVKNAEEKKAADQHFFSIVLASKVSKKNAETYVAQLKKGGFDKAEAVTRSNGTKVIYGHFKTETEAHNFLRNLRSTADDFNDGWIMEFK